MYVAPLTCCSWKRLFLNAAAIVGRSLLVISVPKMVVYPAS